MAEIVFFSSLAGVIALLGFKLFELKRGMKPLSAFRYRVDTFLKKKADKLLELGRFINTDTFKLLGLFLLSEGRELVAALFKKIEESNMGAMVRGRHTPKVNGNGTSSPYLRDIASLKENKKNTLN